jgi:hypothetical protein
MDTGGRISDGRFADRVQPVAYLGMWSVTMLVRDPSAPGLRVTPSGILEATSGADRMD